MRNARGNYYCSEFCLHSPHQSTFFFFKSRLESVAKKSFITIVLANRIKAVASKRKRDEIKNTSPDTVICSANAKRAKKRSFPESASHRSWNTDAAPFGHWEDDIRSSIPTSTHSTSNKVSNKHCMEEKKDKQKENAMAPPSLVFRMCKSILHSRHLNHFTFITTVLIILWQLSKASEGFASQDEETSFYRCLMVYATVSAFQIYWLSHYEFSNKDNFIFFSLQTLSCILPLCLYFLFFVLNNYSQHNNLVGNARVFSKIFCTINSNDVDCRVEVQQFAPKSIFDCKARNSSAKLDFCGTLCQSRACLHTSTNKNKLPLLYPN